MKPTIVIELLSGKIEEKINRSVDKTLPVTLCTVLKQYFVNLLQYSVLVTTERSRDSYDNVGFKLQSVTNWFCDLGQVNKSCWLTVSP